MSNKNIAESGKATRFSTTNQPVKRGRNKGSYNRATIIKAVLSYTDQEWLFFQRTGKLI